ncbi:MULTISPECIES: hypothetical protein [unclassified Nocardia]|uniref:hypothetical protein n=1 Tax=unclassified Nocardia TaxID=2637762 RepID=UPI00278BC4A8|nr:MULTISPECIES: hypothetical protein [unclassified Nocardia]
MPTLLAATQPCLADPNLWLQPDETPWNEVPTAAWAAQQCRTRCPRLTACARDALTAGKVTGLSRHAVASGVIMAGICCDGSDDTITQLTAIAGHTTSPEPMRACRTCRRHFVPAHTPTAARNGGVVEAAGGRCRGCYTRARRTGVIRATRHTHCAQCTRPMTSKQRREPGYVIHGGRGMCEACYKAGMRAMHRTPEAVA